MFKASTAPAMRERKKYNERVKVKMVFGNKTQGQQSEEKGPKDGVKSDLRSRPGKNELSNGLENTPSESSCLPRDLALLPVNLAGVFALHAAKRQYYDPIQPERFVSTVRCAVAFSFPKRGGQVEPSSVG